MTMPLERQEIMAEDEVVNGWWSGDVDISRTPSPGIPAKRMKMTLEDISQDFRATTMQKDSEFSNLLRASRTPDTLGYGVAQSYKDLWPSPRYSSNAMPHDVKSRRSAELELTDRKRKMKTGCIPCLYVVEVQLDQE